MSSTVVIPEGLTVDGLLGKRYVARMVDGVIGTGLALAAGGLVYRAVHGTGTQPLLALLIAFTAALLVVVVFGAACESSAWQATPGKKMLGLRVYSDQGERLSPVRAVKRNVIKEGPFFFFRLVPGIGNLLDFGLLVAHVIVVHRSPVYQAIHDRAAGTLVAASEQTITLRLT